MKVVREVIVSRYPPLRTMLFLCLSACGPSYAPDNSAVNAAPQANKAEHGVIVGVRSVAISAANATDSAGPDLTGGNAATQLSAGPISAFSALGGSFISGLAASTTKHATTDTYEYIVRKANAELVSVTQKDKEPLALAQKVLVVSGIQARVVPDGAFALAAPDPGLTATAPSTVTHIAAMDSALATRHADDVTSNVASAATSNPQQALPPIRN